MVVAPAGCGKTHLIAQAVSYATGRQLILTHTHAGVSAVRARLSSIGVASLKYVVTTIDGFALRYVAAYPILAGFDCRYPEDDAEWRGLRTAAARLFSCRVPRLVLRYSYDGVYVDEYQDCCGTQHSLIRVIADILPCRVVGDPLQSIYEKLNKGDTTSWSEVKQTFPILDELKTPHRWQNSNPELGEWLTDVRQRLLRGDEVDFRTGNNCLRWVQSVEIPSKINTCYSFARKENVVVICGWRNQCVGIAEKMKNFFAVIESVACPELLRTADAIENSSGIDRVAHVVAFSKKCLNGMTDVSDMLKRLEQQKEYRPRSPKKLEIWKAMQAASLDSDLRKVSDLLMAIKDLPDVPIFKSREMWFEMILTLRSFDPGYGLTLREAAWRRRDVARQRGRRALGSRAIATPLLIKGLEFEHAILTDATQMKTAEELYVALTRGAASLTVLSQAQVVQRPQPAWINDRVNEQRNELAPDH